MNKPSENIAAAAALGKIAEIRQFDLDEDYSYLSNMASVLELNEKVSQSTGVNLLSKSKELSVYDIEKYEIFLERIIDQNLSIKLSDSFLADELELMDEAENIPIEKFSALILESDNLARIVKESFRNIGLTVPYIIPILKKPIMAQLVGRDRKNFLSLSKFELKSRNIFVVFHLNEGIKVTHNSTPKSLSSAMVKTDFTAPKNTVGIMSCFFFEENSKYITSPISMFLRGINTYAKDVTVGNFTKKFFLDGVTSKLLIKQGDDIVFDHRLTGKLAGSVQVDKTLTGYHYAFLYGLDIEKMERDYKNRVFL